NLGRASHTPRSRWLETYGRTHHPKRRDWNAQFRDGTDAIWKIIFGGRCGAYRAANRRERFESRGCRCASAGTRVASILRRWKYGTAGSVLGNLFASRVESTAVFLVDD